MVLFWRVSGGLRPDRARGGGTLCGIGARDDYVVTCELEQRLPAIGALAGPFLRRTASGEGKTKISLRCGISAPQQHRSDRKWTVMPCAVFKRH